MGLGLHYRGAPRRAAEVSDLAERLLPGLPGFHAHHGKMVVELRPDGIGKGNALDDLMKRAPVPAPQAGHVRRRRDGRARLRGRQPPWRAFCEDRAWPDCRASPAREPTGTAAASGAFGRQGGGGVSDSTSEKKAASSWSRTACRLATTLRAASSSPLGETLEQSGGIWIGTSRDIVDTAPTELTAHPGLGFDRMSFDLTAAEHETYYLGYSNSVLWPLFHGRADLLELRAARSGRLPRRQQAHGPFRRGRHRTR